MTFRKVLSRVCFYVAITSLLLEGCFMLLSLLGPFFPNPIPERTIVANWCFLTIAAFYFFRNPFPAVLLGWSFLLVSSYMWWLVTDERSTVWFLYQQSLPLAFVLFSTAAAIFWSPAASNETGAYRSPS
jgi:hypothetical protein